MQKATDNVKKTQLACIKRNFQLATQKATSNSQISTSKLATGHDDTAKNKPYYHPPSSTPVASIPSHEKFVKARITTLASTCKSSSPVVNTSFVEARHKPHRIPKSPDFAGLPTQDHHQPPTSPYH
jgi:hypothetical protein